MKNKKGFIATSLMYSFFVVFALLALTILATYSHYRYLNSDLNNSILYELNQKIKSKYARLNNLVKNGGFEGDINVWQTYNSSIITITPGDPTDSTFNGTHSMKMFASMPNHNNTFTQNINVNNLIIDNQYHKIYLRFRAFKKNHVDSNDSDLCLNIGYNNRCYSNYYSSYLTRTYGVSVANGGKVFFADGAPDIYDKKYNWVLHSEIIDVLFDSENLNNNWILNSYINNITSSNGTVYVDDIIIADITDVYGDRLKSLGINNTGKDDLIKEYLDTYLEYFDDNYVIERYDYR